MDEFKEVFLDELKGAFMDKFKLFFLGEQTFRPTERSILDKRREPLTMS